MCLTSKPLSDSHRLKQQSISLTVQQDERVLLCNKTSVSVSTNDTSVSLSTNGGVHASIKAHLCLSFYRKRKGVCASINRGVRACMNRTSEAFAVHNDLAGILVLVRSDPHLLQPPPPKKR